MAFERQVIDSYGLRIAITVPDSSFVPDLEKALPPAWQPAPDERIDHTVSLEARDAANSPIRRAGWFVFVNGKFEWAPNSRDDVTRVLENALEGCLAVHSPAFVFIHAGAVVWNDRAMLFPGQSHAGKSSLVAALIAQGAAYYSDEYAVIGSDGLIYPFARRLSLRDADGNSRPRINAPVDNDARPLAERGVFPGLVAELRHERNAAGNGIKPLTPEETLGVLLQHALGVRTRPAQVMTAIGQVANQAEGLSGVRGEAVITAAWLLQRHTRFPS